MNLSEDYNLCIMSLHERAKFDSKSINSGDKKHSHWNGKKLLQRIANVGKIQKNKIYHSEDPKLVKEGQNRFNTVTDVTKTVHRTPKITATHIDRSKIKPAVINAERSKIKSAAINIERSKIKSVTTKEILTDKKLNANILQGIVKVKREFDADIPSVNAMCSSEKDSVWIGCWNRTPISRLTCNDRIETKEQYDTPCSDMTILPSGDVLFTRFGDCAIKQLSRKDGKITTFRGCMPLYPEGIHATKSGDILVTVVDETSFLVNKSTKRKLIRMTSTGKAIQDIEYGHHRLKLFILPYRVTENVNGDMCVVNRTGKFLGQIVVLDSEGNLKFTYDGNPNLPCTDFIPMGIACDNNGCIIVTDPNDYSIHILDQTGNLIQYLASTKIGISPPVSICVDRSGVLWVGCIAEQGKDGKQSTNKSKVYALC